MKNEGTPKTAFARWFETFLSEKNLAEENWTLVDKYGTEHYIGTEVVKEFIMIADPTEQKKIKTMLVKIDFVNGNVNHFFKHLAGAIINADH